MMPPPDLSMALDSLFQTGEHFRRLYELVRREQEIHPEQYRRLMELETRARIMQEYTCQIVPGLLQTEGYARALIETHCLTKSPEEVEELVFARLGRQKLLRVDPQPQLFVLLDEGAIRRPVGGQSVMREQLSVLIANADTSTTTIRLLPFEYGAHGLMGGTLSIMTLDDGTVVAYEESASTGTLLRNPETIRDQQRTFERLYSQALSPSDTAVFLRAVREECTP